jgi:hypothetical protein
MLWAAAFVTAWLRRASRLFMIKLPVAPTAPNSPSARIAQLTGELSRTKKLRPATAALHRTDMIEKSVPTLMVFLVSTSRWIAPR